MTDIVRIGTICGAEIAAPYELSKQLDEFGVGGARRWLCTSNPAAIPPGTPILVLVWDVPRAESRRLRVLDTIVEDDSAPTQEN